MNRSTTQSTSRSAEGAPVAPPSRVRGIYGWRTRRWWTGVVSVLMGSTAAVQLGSLDAVGATVKTVEVVSADDAGIRGNGVSEQPVLSADGRYAAFVSAASNLVPGDTNARADIFVRDRVAGTTERVNLTSSGGQSTGTVGANGQGGLDISGDGRVVAFNTNAALVPEDTNANYDAYVRDLDTGALERVSVAGTRSGSSASDVSLNHDGRYVAFVSSQLAANNTRVDVLVHDRDSGTSKIVSVRHPEVPATTRVGSSQSPSLSDDGRFIAYSSAAADQVLGDTNGQQDIFVRDMANNITTRASVAKDGAAGSLLSVSPAISGTGRYVTFLTYSAQLMPGDSNAQPDYVRKDTITGEVTQISVGNGTSGVGPYTAEGPAPISTDGRYVAFSSRPGLAAGTTSQAQVYLRDVDAGTTEAVTAGANSFSTGVTLTNDGATVAFSTASTNLIPGTTTSGRQILAVHYDRAVPPGDTTPPVVTPSVTPATPDGDNQWYQGVVNLAWTVSDPESPVSLSGCTDQVIDEDQQRQTYTCTATSAGGSTGPVSVHIGRDATPPLIDASVDPTAPDGVNGWYITQPLVTFTCTDLTSEIAACADVTHAPEGHGTSVTGTATDNAGNTTSQGAGPFNIDLSDPDVDCQPAGPFTLDQDGEVTADVTDAISGPAASQVAVTADTSTVGNKLATLVGLDRAGRSATESCGYRVQYAFSGFADPVNPDAANVVNAGSTIPLKWHLAGASGAPVTDLTSVLLRVTAVSCDPDAEEDPLTETTTGDAGLKNHGDGNYQYNWKTQKNYAGSCRILRVDFGEGSSHDLHFRFTR